jgi:hypothetical protein
MRIGRRNLRLVVAHDRILLASMKRGQGGCSQ